MNFVITEFRKWTCFVCGHQYNTFEEYKDHIFDRHEVGRDYVVCPLARCAAPVRDIKLHYKAIHPHEKLPEKGQMRAIVFRDIRDPKRKKKKQPFKEGYVFSLKNGGKQMHFRSGYEKDVYDCLEQIDEVVSYRVEALSIEYFFRGKQKNYYPDLCINFADGHTEVWEIKPSSQTSLELNEAKWKSARAYCEKRGWTFMVMTEKGIQQLKKATFRLNEQKKPPSEDPD